MLKYIASFAVLAAGVNADKQYYESPSQGCYYPGGCQSDACCSSCGNEESTSKYTTEKAHAKEVYDQFYYGPKDEKADTCSSWQYQVNGESVLLKDILQKYVTVVIEKDGEEDRNERVEVEKTKMLNKLREALLKAGVIAKKPAKVGTQHQYKVGKENFYWVELANGPSDSKDYKWDVPATKKATDVLFLTRVYYYDSDSKDNLYIYLDGPVVETKAAEKKTEKTDESSCCTCESSSSSCSTCEDDSAYYTSPSQGCYYPGGCSSDCCCGACGNDTVTQTTKVSELKAKNVYNQFYYGPQVSSSWKYFVNGQSVLIKDLENIYDIDGEILLTEQSIALWPLRRALIEAGQMKYVVKGTLLGEKPHLKFVKIPAAPKGYHWDLKEGEKAADVLYITEVYYPSASKADALVDLEVKVNGPYTADKPEDYEQRAECDTTHDEQYHAAKIEEIEAALEALFAMESGVKFNTMNSKAKAGMAALRGNKKADE